MSTFSITVQETSNPAIIKFEANQFLTKHTSHEYNNIDEAKNSPLAQQLFYLPFVKKVFISGNFVAAERFNIVNWKDVQEEVAKQIEDFLNEGGEAVIEDGTAKKVPVTIYAESTPNPAAMKFVANKKLVVSSFEFKNLDDARHSPLATELFSFPFVKELFFDENYISILKYDVSEWDDIIVQLREFIKSYIENDKVIISADAPILQEKSEAVVQEKFEKLDDISKQIVNILEEYVKPAVASDGGNIEFQSYDEASKTVQVILQGACSGCPSSTFTLKNGIENMLKEMLGDKVQSVVALNG
jgi:Fe-S cluster biogenesis protein NfuA